MALRSLLILALCSTASVAAAADSLYRDVTETSLPKQPSPKHSMNTIALDLDADGDLDLAVAVEYGANILYFNDGRGCFSNFGVERLAQTVGDFEDVSSADFDGDGDPDLVFVGEDDQVYGYHLNNGRGFFLDVTGRLPSRGTSNAVETADLDGDGDADLYVGNNGQDFVFINDGRGFFIDETASRLPPSSDVTQHVAVGDIDGDRDVDVLLGNEGGNALLLNDGTGRFARIDLPRATPEESRDADLVDVDGDGDLDIVFSNVDLFVDDADPQSRLLLNDGSGLFTDVTAEMLPLANGRSTYASGFVDFDRDGDLDLVTGTMGDLTGRTATAPWLAYANDGAGHFIEMPGVLPDSATGNGFDIAVGDYNGDGLEDLFLASRGGPDRLLLRTGGAEPAACSAR